MVSIDITSKRNWAQVLPDGYDRSGKVVDLCGTPYVEDKLSHRIQTQGDFIRQYYPSGHVINDRMVHPDILRQYDEPVYDELGEQTGTKTSYYWELIPRCAVAYQQIIACKHLVHLCGNDIQIELSEKTDESLVGLFHEWVKGWYEHNMEIAFYEAALSEEITADAALVFVMFMGKMSTRVFSYKTGSILYPHYAIDGETMECFARKFSETDEEGASATYLEVWDNKFYYLLKLSSENGEDITFCKGKYVARGYQVISKDIHGFTECPCLYKRNDSGPGWSFSQDTIEQQELLISQLKHNNHEYGEPILVYAGDENFQPQVGDSGTIKAVSMGKEDKLSYLQGQSASDSFMKEIEMNDINIYRQSFVLDPPKISNSDVSGIAVKILYSPAVEYATNQAKQWQNFVNGMVRLFSYGYGLEQGKTLAFANLPISAWIKPYVPESMQQIVADIVGCVGSGILSKQTGSERITEYAVANEWERLVREQKESQQHELLETM